MKPLYFLLCMLVIALLLKQLETEYQPEFKPQPTIEIDTTKPLPKQQY